MSIITDNWWFALVTVTVLTITVSLFAFSKLRSDLVAFGAVLSMVLFEVLTPREGLSGFSNTIIMTIACMFIIGGAIVRTGLANIISDKILGLAGTNQNTLFMFLMFITAMIGSLVSNTGTVAIMMPIVVTVAHSINASPSRFLMPVAFMSGMGGMLTLIGNPPNMVVNEIYVNAGFQPLTLFSFLPVGLICLVFGMVIMAPATSYFLSRRKNVKVEDGQKEMSLKDLADRYHLATNIYKLKVPPDSPLAGKSLAELNLNARYKVLIHEIRRGKKTLTHLAHFGQNRVEQISPGPQTIVNQEDILYGMGTLEHVQALVAEGRLEMSNTTNKKDADDKYIFDAIGICELVLMSSSRFIKQTIECSKLREQFGITILGIHRGDQYILEDVKDQAMMPGDALLVQAPWDRIAHLENHSHNWVVVGRPQDKARDDRLREKAPVVAAIIIAMITVMATSLLPTVAAAMLAALLVIASGCFKNIEDVYSSINWETLVMIACMLPMAIGMEKAGLVAAASSQIINVGVQYGPYMALALVYAITSGLNIIISSTPVSLLVAPVAIQTALSLNVSPLPFVFAVAAAASLCFASPFSTPANVLVMSAGRYTFFDYLKIGLPMQILMGVVLVLALPRLFSF